MSDSVRHRWQPTRLPIPWDSPGKTISLYWSLKKTFLSLLVILWNSAFRCLYLSFSPLLFPSLLFTAICKASPDSHFAFLGFQKYCNKWFVNAMVQSDIFYKKTKKLVQAPRDDWSIQYRWKDQNIINRLKNISLRLFLDVKNLINLMKQSYLLLNRRYFSFSILQENEKKLKKETSKENCILQMLFY